MEFCEWFIFSYDFYDFYDFYDIFDFESEAGIRVFYNIPPLDERKRNAIINDFLIHLGLLANNSGGADNSNKIFGLFRR